MRPFTEEALMESDNVKFYTGLPSFSVLKTVFKFVAPPIAHQLNEIYMIVLFLYDCI